MATGEKETGIEVSDYFDGSSQTKKNPPGGEPEEGFISSRGDLIVVYAAIFSCSGSVSVATTGATASVFPFFEEWIWPRSTITRAALYSL